MTIAFAEFIGTALLVFVTCMGCTKGMFGESIPVLQMSLASGLSVTTAIQVSYCRIGNNLVAYVTPRMCHCAKLPSSNLGSRQSVKFPKLRSQQVRT